jgi:serine/threonine protein kinase
MELVKSRPQVFKNYRILRDYGGGGAGGRVYKVQHKVSDQVCIIKVKFVKPHRFAAVSKRIIDQFELLKRIPKHEHKGIIHYYELYGVANTKRKKYEILIVMEYMAGQDLFKVMQCMDEFQYQVTVQEAYLFLKNSFQVLEELHSRNIAHRDIKPENWVMGISETFSEGASKSKGLKLIDFDTACVDYPSFKKVEGQDGEILCDYNHYPGTEIYFPPEVREAYDKNASDPNLDPKSADVWCEGVVVLDILMRGVSNSKYPMFEGTLGKTNIIMDKKKVGGKYIEIKTFLNSSRMKTSEISIFRPLMMKILATNPKERITSSQILRELESIKKNNPDLELGKLDHGGELHEIAMLES